ncbi:hypothetical protein [Deinococcus hohokamensis]|uniref:Uncharacterized protein n=1 Tax=Deinococcus hohokamensis TaxID=309883 RepID=A0ABV9I4W9_9DEIO
MRLLLLVLALVVAAVYATFGLRFGYVTLTPTYMWHATGQNSYSYRTYEAKQVVGVQGSCKVSNGRATLRLYDPRGAQIAGQTCQKGQWALNLSGSGAAGNYRLVIDLEKFSGMIDLKEVRGGE